MFQSAEIGHKLSKTAYREAVPTLRAALLAAQIDLFEQHKTPVVVLISGQDGAGKGETINVLYEWMDPRFISTLAFSQPSDEERERPPMWRYWHSLPPKGRVSMFAGSWYSDPIRERIEGAISIKELDARAQQINRFEEMLVNEGALVLKFWFHLTKEGQKQRLTALSSDPRTAWRVTQWNWDRLKTYDQLQDVAGHLLRVTNTAAAPWVVVEGTDDRYRCMTVGQVLLKAMQNKLATKETLHTLTAPMVRVDLDGRNVLSELDLTLTLANKPYKDELAKWQGRLSELVRDARFKNRSLVCAFEGADAAGKGGAIRRIAAALDARQYQVTPVAAPTDEEKAQPYLWRFWHKLPRHGRVAIFDRTWYGRVLVERVEGFCSETDWLRGYSEINDFEHELIEAGVIVVKFWLQISQAEQLKRFKEREQIEFKRFKITQEDWRNREKWNDYQQAICDMVERTSTGEAPWTLVEANDKNYARVKILRTLCEHLASALQKQPKLADAPTVKSAKAKKINQGNSERKK
ncbi:polyphosphate:AMP phosphotransferase [Rhodoferax sp.]|uniref:polyphosphate:AMP phosphotransferase n=1 Tax=Rhodoferax sp. TaxID=50421 RepID=UPI0008AE2AFB|nr:polyphosphate:AMP phosphotransferase [Rhodoferax sp.]MDO8320965.1 polyphosphate:AMP phosphotransferase [Rhodoferax sp.]MDP2678614.1 polyphosphate:AMP phosphotransferase [Rhodoferax sp.]OGB54573.1 MAG: polyphosphate:AMP phosphotransferase [Burkholderiales bacterium RIFOXYD12_FULL_59_19]